MGSGLEFCYQIGDEIMTVRVEPEGDAYRVSIGDRAYRVSMTRAASGEAQLRVNGARHVAHVAASGSTRYVSIDGVVVALGVPDAKRARCWLPWAMPSRLDRRW